MESVHKKMDSISNVASICLYKIPDSIKIQKIIGEISKNFPIKKDSPLPSRQVFFDTFDWRLYEAGLSLIKVNNEFLLCSLQTELPVEKAFIHAQIQPRFWWDFPDGSLKDALKNFLDVRALIKLIEIESDFIQMRILNSDQKTVLKAKFEKSYMILPRQKNKLTDCIKIIPVRGYDQDYNEFKNWLNEAGIAQETKPAFLLALETVGKKPGDYSTKLNFTLLPEMTAREAATAILKFLWQVIQQNIAGIKKDIDTEFLHDFRVAIRRTRSVLSQIKGVFPDDVRDRFRADFAVLQKSTNQLRDLDVYLLNKEKYQQMLPEHLRPGLQPLFNQLQSERAAEHKYMLKTFDDKSYGHLVQQWDSFLKSISALPNSKNSTERVIDIARKFIFKAYHNVIEIGSQIKDDSPSSALHQLRIACKKLRYLLEFFASLFPEEEISLLVSQLKKLQDNLGDYNDLLVQQRSLKKYLEAITAQNNRDAVDSISAIGGLIAALYQQQQNTRKAFAQTFVEFSGHGNEKIYQKLFA